MTKKDYDYLPVRLPKRLRARVVKLARAENRGIGRQAEMMIELGIAEYERQQKARAGVPDAARS